MAFLCNGDVFATLPDNQASACKLADIIVFATHFDQIKVLFFVTKMNNPNIQNDFSYYRRSVSKMKLSNSVL
jgi:hypothetical protein